MMQRNNDTPYNIMWVWTVNLKSVLNIRCWCIGLQMYYQAYVLCNFIVPAMV